MDGFCKATKRLIRNRRGAAAVELSLLFPIFILMVLGTFELGRALYAYHALENAVSEAARFAIVRGAESDQPATKNDIESIARDALKSVDQANVIINVQFQPDNSRGSKVRVDSTYTMDLLIPYVNFDGIALNRSAEMFIAR